ncbi:MAG TPA: hypothetical protein P5572_17205 [Phycisphaerae bacterium]|nr:hypothetical protein [Phycisphaerae bacterium]
MGDQILGSRSSIDIHEVERFLQPHIERALRAVVAEEEAAALIDGSAAGLAAQAVTAALQGPCFSSGLAVVSAPTVAIASPAYQRMREAEQRAARALDEHEAQSELRDALASAQRAQLEHLEGMLARLNQLAENSPQVELPELMRSFEETQRGQLYAALLATRARKPVTRYVAVVAGHELLFFDPQGTGDIVRRVRIEQPAGALRSVQYDSEAGLVLLGAAHGIYMLAPDATEPQKVLRAPEDRAVRGGFNAVALRGDNVVATHSERGIVHWRLGEPEESRQLFADLIQGASAVRNARFAGDRFWCSYDANVLSAPADDLAAAPVVHCINPYSSISALLVVGDQVYLGNSDGDLHVTRFDGAPPRLLHGGSRRPVESIALVTAGGIPRLLYTDTSLAVFCRVIGDTFTCRYEAGGQTVRRAESAADIIAATTDARDRVLLWRSDEPERPAAVINVLRLTGHSVQDVCLIPHA